MFLSNRLSMTTKELFTGQRINHQRRQALPIPSWRIKDLWAECEAFANKAQTKNCYELELQCLKKIARTKPSSLQMQKERASSHLIWLKDWSQPIVARLVSNMPKISVRAVAAHRYQATISYYYWQLIFEIFINKGVVFSGRVYLHADQMESWSSLEP